MPNEYEDLLRIVQASRPSPQRRLLGGLAKALAVAGGGDPSTVGNINGDGDLSKLILQEVVREYIGRPGEERKKQEGLEKERRERQYQLEDEERLRTQKSRESLRSRQLERGQLARAAGFPAPPGWARDPATGQLHKLPSSLELAYQEALEQGPVSPPVTPGAAPGPRPVGRFNPLRVLPGFAYPGRPAAPAPSPPSQRPLPPAPAAPPASPSPAAPSLIRPAFGQDDPVVRTGTDTATGKKVGMTRSGQIISLE